MKKTMIISYALIILAFNFWIYQLVVPKPDPFTVWRVVMIVFLIFIATMLVVVGSKEKQAFQFVINMLFGIGAAITLWLLLFIFPSLYQFYQELWPEGYEAFLFPMMADCITAFYLLIWYLAPKKCRKKTIRVLFS